ncbi:unnamed protein product, partial [Symbiodinium sp. CCMP2456]
YPTRAESLKVLQEISLSLSQGESAAILGPSGCGKSTLLYCIGTLEAPTSGSVTLDGQDPFALSETELARFRSENIGFIFQDHHLLPQLSVLENVLVPTLAVGKSTPQQIERAKMLIDRVGLSQRIEHRSAELSGGERQRVAVARSLIHQPKLLLADEPTGNLDKTNAESVGNLLLELQKEEGSILIVVTHSQELATIFQQQFQLDDGKLQGQPPEVLTMNRWRLVLRSAQQFWQTNLAVLLGVAAATAVLTGALIIGDSVRGSLRDLALSRLGSIQEILLADRFFRPNVAEQIAQQNENTTTVPIVLMQGTLQTIGGSPDDPTRVAGNLAVLGIEETFWQLGDVPGWTPTPIGDEEIILNQPLADELETQSLPRLTVKAIIPAEGLGRFGMHPTQQLPMNAYASKAALQDALEQDDRVNAVLVSHPEGQTLDLSKLFLTLADYNFELTQVEQTFQPDDGQQQTIFDYWQLTSSRMIFSNTAADAVEKDFRGDAHPTFTYLATSIGKGELPSGDDTDAIPYSTVTALQASDLDYPLLDLDGNRIDQIGPDEVVLNSWTANQLDAKVGDTIYLKYFEPESSHGEAKETGQTFRLVAITPLTEPDQPFRRRRPPVFETAPTTANDPDYTPVVEGITDQDSIDDWDP